MRVRGSKSDIAWHCAGSLVATDTPYAPQTDEAREGRAKHEALSYVPKGQQAPLSEIADKYDVDVDELERAVRYGQLAWKDVGQWLPNARTEEGVEGPVTVGTADVLSVGENGGYVPASLVILDWKTGYSGDEHQCQLKSYADAARAEWGMPTSGCVTGIEVWIRLREYNVRNFTAEMLDGFRSHMAEQIKSAESDYPQYGAGPHCKFCVRQNQCPARDAFLRATVTALVPADGQPQAITREVLGQLYERSKVITRALAAYTKLLDSALEEGPITLPDGRMLGLKNIEQDEIEAVKALAILRAEFGFTDAELAEVLGATKSGIERVVKSRVAKGGAAAEMRRVLGRLREAGAIDKTIKQQKEITDA